MQASQEQRLTCSYITVWGEAYRMELHTIIYCEKIFIVSVCSNFTQIKMKMMFSVINKFCNKVLVISSAQEYLKSSHQTAFLRGPLTPNPLMGSARPLP